MYNRGNTYSAGTWDALMNASYHVEVTDASVVNDGFDEATTDPRRPSWGYAS